MSERRPPDWYFQPELRLEDGGDRVVLFAGPNEDQEGLLFLRVDDIDGGAAVVGLGPTEATKMRDMLTAWLDWCQQRGIEGEA